MTDESDSDDVESVPQEEGVDPYIDVLTACNSLARRMRSNYEWTIADEIVRKEFQKRLTAAGLSTRPAEAPSEVYRKLREVIHSTDWTRVAERVVKEVQTLARELQQASWTERNQMPKTTFVSWYWADAYFRYSWLGSV